MLQSDAVLEKHALQTNVNALGIASQVSLNRGALVLITQIQGDSTHGGGGQKKPPSLNRVK